MIIAIYAGLGIFLIKGSYDLPGSKLLIEFTIWGGLVMHATIMAIEVALDWDNEWSHISPWGDVTTLYFLAALLGFFYSRVDWKKCNE